MGLDILHGWFCHVRDVRDNRTDLLIAEGQQRNRFDDVFALQVDQERTQGVASPKLVLTAGSHDDNGYIVQATSKIGEQLATAAIGPLDVV